MRCYSSDSFSNGHRALRHLIVAQWRVCLAAALCTGIAAAAQAATYNSFAAWSAAAGAHTTLDFEDYAPGTIITNQYANRTPAGVVFSSVGRLEIADAAEVLQETGGVPVSGTRVLDVELPDTEALLARFVVTGTNTPTTLRAAGAWMIDVGTFAGSIARFYDANNNVIDSLTIAPNFESNQFFGAINSVGIARVTFDGVAAGEFVLIDDFVYSNIPEPATAALFALAGMALIGARRHRCTRRQAQVHSPRLPATVGIALSIAFASPGLAQVQIVEPDAFPAGTDLSNAYPGVTLSDITGGSGAVNDVVSRTSALASTGTRVFGRFNGDIAWGNGGWDFMRIDIAGQITSASLDFISDDPSDSNPVLAAYNGAGNLITSSTVPGDFGTGAVVPLTVSAPGIATVLALGDPPPNSFNTIAQITAVFAGGPDNWVLDNLRIIRVPEPGTLVGFVVLLAAASLGSRPRRMPRA